MQTCTEHPCTKAPRTRHLGDQETAAPKPPRADLRRDANNTRARQHRVLDPSDALQKYIGAPRHQGTETLRCLLAQSTHAPRHRGPFTDIGLPITAAPNHRRAGLHQRAGMHEGTRLRDGGKQPSLDQPKKTRHGPAPRHQDSKAP